MSCAEGHDFQLVDHGKSKDERWVVEVVLFCRRCGDTVSRIVDRPWAERKRTFTHPGAVPE
jgi:hypothetical protein